MLEYVFKVLVGLFLSKLKVSVSVSIFETDDGLSLNFFDQRQKSQYQSERDQFYKLSVSKFDTNFKSLSLSISN